MATGLRLVLVRHGETEWSRTKRHTGWSDIPLTPLGERQATALARPLSAWTFERVLVSPLQRARATCALAGLAAVAEEDPDLREWCYGAYEGRLSSEIAAERPGWNVFDDGVVDGETIDEVAQRARRVIGRLAGVEGDVLLVAHGHLLRILAAVWLAEPPRFARHLLLGPAAISVLGHEHEQPAVASWNDEHHLRDLLPED